MPSILYMKVCFLSCLIFFCSLNFSPFASELIFPELRVKEKTVSGILYFAETRKELLFQVGSNILPSQNKSKEIIFKVTLPLSVSIYPWIKIGQGLKGYNFSLLSENYTSDFLTWTYGGGIRLLLFPETVVNPGIFFDFGYDYANWKINRVSSSGSPAEKVDYSLENICWQGALLGSQHFSRKGEFYLGIRFLRNVNRLREDRTEIRGKNNIFSPFLGAHFGLGTKGKIVFELSFLKEKIFSLGASYQLKL